MHKTMETEIIHQIAFGRCAPRRKDVHWLHIRCIRYYMDEHKSVQCH